MVTRCDTCLMDTSDTEIVFFDDGTCNHCRSYSIKVKDAVIPLDQRKDAKKQLIAKIRAGGNKNIDCVIGISGGVDSCYVAYLAKEMGLRALLVHLDNGWNSISAYSNILGVLDYTGFELYTNVLYWPEFRAHQLSFMKADVVDIELLTDHAIKATLYEVARKNGVKSIINGGNVRTECIMPKTWRHSKSDSANIIDICRKHEGSTPRKYPTFSLFDQITHSKIHNIKSVQIFNYVGYDHAHAISILKEKCNWTNYGSKHTESFFTAFYQQVILTRKFNIDKRKCHLSALIMSGSLSREDALEQLNLPLTHDTKESIDYFCDKMNMSTADFHSYLMRRPVSHYEYKTNENIHEVILSARRFLRW